TCRYVEVERIILHTEFWILALFFELVIERIIFGLGSIEIILGSAFFFDFGYLQHFVDGRGRSLSSLI
ncbi:hypothetical protein, partial [Staphylococcus warneri]|uniref:hypothetical protein n=1 Tax=Staphylococcus warneri TaxID=1292 RepID=UPI0030C3A295